MVQMQQATIKAGLQADILRLQGFKPAGGALADVGLNFMREAFPQGTFPLGAVHEFVHTRAEDATATTGFVAVMLAALMKQQGTALWISAARTVFPPGLKSFGIDPDRIVFVDLQKEKHVLWAMEEALKCNALAGVVGEVHDLSFTASRRLQLAVEQSRVTGFVMNRRANIHQSSITACVSRWRITSLPGVVMDDMPGIGFPQWQVELLRMRNGKPGRWNIQLVNRKLVPVHEEVPFVLEKQKMKAG